MSYTSVDMAPIKKTMTKSQMAKVHKELKQATEAKQREQQTKNGGKVPCKHLETKAAWKSALKKPRCNWSLIVPRDINPSTF